MTNDETELIVRLRSDAVGFRVALSLIKQGSDQKMIRNIASNALDRRISTANDRNEPQWTDE